MKPQLIILKKLHSLCEYVKDHDLEKSAPIISQYAGLWLENIELIPLSEEILEEKNNDMMFIQQEEKRIYRKIITIVNQTKKYIKKNNINNDFIIHKLNFLKFKSNIDSNALFVMYCELFAIFKWLLHDKTINHRDFIKKHASLDELSIDCPIKLNVNIDKLGKACNYIGRISTNKLWYYLDRLLSFMIAFDPKKYAFQINLAQKRHAIYGIQLDIMSNALNNSIGPTKNHDKPFINNLKEYHFWMYQLYLYAEQELNPKNSLIDIKILDWQYCIATRVFTYKNKTKRFHEFKATNNSTKGKKYNGFPSEILKILTQNKNHNFLEFKYILKTILNNPDYDDTKVIYDACIDINKTILKKTGLEDFLTITPNSVKINSKYHL